MDVRGVSKAVGLATMGLALSVTGGCSDVCGSPTQLNGRTFSSFGTMRTFALDALEGDEADFPAESSPANGPIDIAFDWTSDLPQGPLQVTLDGQPSDDGSGQWSQVNCGNFTASWAGSYTGEDGSLHVFVAAGYFVQYLDQLEGFIDWEEEWRATSGAEGTFSGDVLLQGDER